MGKPTVTLTLAGDEKKLTEAFDKVGASSKTMADKVDGASKSMRDTGKGFESAVEGFDTVDTRAMGFRDTVTGVSDTMKGLTDDSLSLEEKLLTLGMGIGDLASGFVNLLLPALRSMWVSLTTTVIPAIWSFTAALLANPITWVVIGIIALIAIIVLLVKHWDWVKNVVGNVVGWIVDRWKGLMGWFAGLPDWFGKIFGAVGNAIGSAFKASINFVIGIVNWAIDKINWLLDRINDVSGIVGIPSIPHIPHIPRMHTGGIVPGMPGQEVPIMAMAGERVTPASQAGGSGTLRVIGDTDTSFISYLQMLADTGQLQLGGS